MASVLDAFVRFIADTSNVKQAMGPGGAIAQQAGMGGQVAGQTFGQKMGNGISKMAVPLGATAGLVFASGLEAGVKFEDQLRTINTVAGLTDEQLAGVGDEIQALSRETGKTTTDLAAGYYDLVSAGVDSADAIGVLRDSAIFATGALGSTAESVDLVTSVMNAYGMEASDSARITDVFAKAVADGKVTAAQLGQVIANIAPLAASAGVSMEEVASGFAFLTAKGVPAAQAATQMRASISALLTPNEQLNRIQQQTGINFAELAREKGLAVALEALRVATEDSAGELDKLSQVSAKDFPKALKKAQKALGLTNSDVEKFIKMAGKDGMTAVLNELSTQVGESDSGFAKALGSVDAYGFALATTGQNADEFGQQITDTLGANGIALDQYAEKSKSAAEQGKRFGATIETFLQDIGGPFVSTIGPAIGALGNLGLGMMGLISPAKLAGGAIGGLVGKIASSLVDPKGALKGAGTRLGGLFAAAFRIAGAVVGGIVDLIVTALTTIKTVLAKIAGAGTKLGGVFAAAFKLAGAAVSGVIDLITGVLGGKGALGKLGGAGARAGVAMTGAMGAAAAAAVPAAIAAFVVAVGIGLAVLINETFPGLAKYMADNFKKGLEAVGGFINDTLNNVKGWVSDVRSNLAGFFNWLFGKTAAAQASIGAVVGATKAASTGLNRLADQFATTPTFGKIPQYAGGTTYVPEDQIAFLHRGEMVIPAREADVLRRGGDQDPSWKPPSGGCGDCGGGGSTTYNIPLHFDGIVPADHVTEVPTMLRRIGEQGLLPNRDKPAVYPVVPGRRHYGPSYTGSVVPGTYRPGGSRG